MNTIDSYTTCSRVYNTRFLGPTQSGGGGGASLGETMQLPTALSTPVDTAHILYTQRANISERGHRGHLHIIDNLAKKMQPAKKLRQSAGLARINRKSNARMHTVETISSVLHTIQKKLVSIQ